MIQIIRPTDLDGKTIHVNAANKVEVVSTGVEFEPVDVTYGIDGIGSGEKYPMYLQVGNTQVTIDKMARIKGTNWLVFSSSDIAKIIPTK